MFRHQVLDKLEENLLAMLLHRSPVAEVAMQETQLLRIGSIGDKHVGEFHTRVTQEQRCLVSLLLRQRLVEQIENVLTGVVTT
jgi:hypothetical protein